ncbi:hypothetical protein SmJEL517_g00509 [Synchytrium microbalum]|uniref:Cytochrome b561 domain-containing protein n=1 Tax=Synchytrium microbalum TaxID=1806994 RepID=A0A507CDW1_9FUNG|nr:uncharacterized protein SmJEL517_g00509 [Synchytrium microbalum]TPX37528.1 hypothetical protein SmJEL517_g00509 [Synchytrium microbalum]
MAYMLNQTMTVVHASDIAAAPRHKQPVAYPDQSLVTIVPEESGIFGDRLVATFLRPLVPANTSYPAITTDTPQSFIWAVSPTGGNATGHGPQGRGIVAAANMGAETAPYNGQTGSIGAPAAETNRQDLMVQAHGALMFLAFMVCMPLAIFAAMFAKWHGFWFKIHWGLMSLAVIFIAVAFGLVYGERSEQGDDHIDTNDEGSHSMVGIVVIALSFFQWVWGIMIDRLYNEKRTAVPWWDYLHHWMGRAILITSWVAIGLGISLYNSGNPINTAVIGIVWAWGSFIVALFIILLINKIIIRRRHGGIDPTLEKSAETKTSYLPDLRHTPSAVVDGPTGVEDTTNVKTGFRPWSVLADRRTRRPRPVTQSSAVTETTNETLTNDY